MLLQKGTWIYRPRGSFWGFMGIGLLSGMRVRGNSLSFSGASDKVFWKNDRARGSGCCLGAPALRAGAERSRRFRRGGMLTPSRHCDSRAFHTRQSRRILESGSLAPPPAALRRFPTFSFVLAKDKVNCPEGKREAPGGKRAAPGTKENRLFIGLLVRPVKTGLVSSSCAERRAFPERSRRSCFVGCKPKGAKRTRGPFCAAAARPGIRRMLLPAGMQAFFFCLLSGGAVAQSSPICTNRLLKARQMRPKRTGHVRQ